MRLLEYCYTHFRFAVTCESTHPTRTSMALVEDNINVSHQIMSLAAVETYLVAQHVAPRRCFYTSKFLLNQVNTFLNKRPIFISLLSGYLIFYFCSFVLTPGFV